MVQELSSYSQFSGYKWHRLRRVVEGLIKLDLDRATTRVEKTQDEREKDHVLLWLAPEVAKVDLPKAVELMQQMDYPPLQIEAFLSIARAIWEVERTRIG